MYRKRFIMRDYHLIMEAEKSYDLPFASSGPQKAGGMVPVQTQRSKNQGSQL